MKAKPWGECVQDSGEDANQRPGCSRPPPPPAGRCRSLQGFQKRDQGVAVGRGQGLVPVARAGRLAPVRLDRLAERRVPPVVQERLGVPPIVSSVRTAGFVTRISALNAPALNSSSAGTKPLRPKRPSRPSVKRLGRPEMPSWFLSSGSA